MLLNEFLKEHRKVQDLETTVAPQESPSGGKICLTLKPTKKLVITTEQKSSEGSASSTSTNFIAEKDGKFVIPVPGPCR